MKKLDTGKLFALLFVVTLIFIIAMLLSLMSGWAVDVRIGVFSVCAALAVLYVFRELKKQVKSAETSSIGRGPTHEEALLSAVNVMVTDRLKELDAAILRGGEGLEEMGEAESSLRQAREFSVASALATAPDVVVQREAVVKLALNRAWRILKLQCGAALVWKDELRAEIVAVEGKDVARGERREIVLDPLGAQSLRNAALTDFSRDRAFSGVLPDAKTRIAVPVQVGEYRWGWFLLESCEEKKVTAQETRFLSALGNELATAMAVLDDWKAAREDLLSVLARASDHVSARRSRKKGRGECIAALYEASARNLGMDEREIEAGKLSAVLMDIGEIGVPELVLEKKGSLTPQEMRFVKEHPALSVKFIRAFLMLKQVEETIIAHHESWLGNGYPVGLKEEQIPRAARLLSVCDAMEAMISERPHRSSYETADAIVELKKLSGVQFDPKMVAAVTRVHEPWINWILSK